jgi:hypothetical protein
MRKVPHARKQGESRLEKFRQPVGQENGNSGSCSARRRSDMDQRAAALAFIVLIRLLGARQW